MSQTEFHMTYTDKPLYFMNTNKVCLKDVLKIFVCDMLLSCTSD